MDKKKILGLLGIGTVGSGTFAVLKRNQEEIARRAGREIIIKIIADRDIDKARGIVGDDGTLITDDANEVVTHPDVDIVVETIGGYELAKELVLTAIENGKVQVRMLRDPSILTAPRWLENEGIALNDVVLYEEPFVSLQASVVEEKLNRLLSVYPAVTSRTDEKNNLKFSGNLPLGALTQFTRELNAIPGILQLKPDLSGISITAGQAMSNKALKEALMAELAAQVSAVKIDFATNQQALAPSQTQTLEDLTLLLKQLQDVAQQLNLTFAVFVMGASDNSGTPTRNLELSRARAKNVSEALKNMGINEDVLFPIGLGQVSLQEASMGRTVFINVLVSQRSSNEGETP